MSWLRQDKTQILAAGSYTYVNDNRFTALHSQRDDTWTLSLMETKISDSGVFECQVTFCGNNNDDNESHDNNNYRYLILG